MILVAMKEALEGNPDCISFKLLLGQSKSQSKPESRLGKYISPLMGETAELHLRALMKRG